MKYTESMASIEKEKWQKSVDQEHQIIIDNKVWKYVPKDEVPKESKVTTITWACKNKPNEK